MKKKTIKAAAAVLTLGLALTGCSATASGSSVENADVTAKAEQAIADLKGTIQGTDPNGVKPAGFDSTELTPDEVEQIKALGLKAGVAMHSMSDAWSVQLVAGLEAEFEALGIELVGVTDAENDPAKQTTQVESLLAADPDFIVSLPTDPVAMVDAFKKANAAGVKLVFSTLVPNGFEPGDDYVSMVSDDRYSSGLISGYQLAAAVGGKGQVGIVFHDADNFTTKQSYLGVVEALKEFPEIEVIEQGVIGPDFAGDAQAAVNAMLTKYPNMVGAWGVWDLPAEGIMAAARAAGRQDLKITTIGFGQNVAVALAKNEMITGLTSIDSFSEGRAEARLGAAAVIGKEGLPAFVASQPVVVNHDNVLDAWEEIYHEKAPDAVKNAYAD